MVLGLVFVGFGLYFSGGHGPAWFVVVLGVAFFIFGISQLYMTKKIRKQFREKKA